MGALDERVNIRQTYGEEILKNRDRRRVLRFPSPASKRRSCSGSA